MRGVAIASPADDHRVEILLYELGLIMTSVTEFRGVI
jgi:hypothetical protein